MAKLITIKTFTYPSEAYVLKGRLQADGIECFLKDENTIQANPMYSHAIGGIKLQVKDSDYEFAKIILEENGYEIESEDGLLISFTRLESLTHKIPIVNKIRVELRAVLILVFSISIISGLILFITKKSVFEELSENSWCLEKVWYDGEYYYPNTIKNYKIVFVGHCYEKIQFKKDLTLELPGFESRSVSGYWKLVDKNLIITNVTDLDSLYNQTYSYEFINDNLILKSKVTTLFCQKEQPLFQ